MIASFGNFGSALRKLLSLLESNCSAGRMRERNCPLNVIRLKI